MAQGRNNGKSSESFRLHHDEKRVARQAAKLESQRTGKRIGWTVLVAKIGVQGCRRIVNRAIRESAAAL